MTKGLRSLIAVVGLVWLALPTPALAQTYFWWTVADERGEIYTGQNVQCSVFRPNIHAAIVLHTTSAQTAGGQSPIFSDIDGRLHFYSSSSAPVDITCYYAHGGQAQVNTFRSTDHKIIIPRQSGLKVSRFSVANGATATNVNSGITLPQGAVVRDVLIQNLNPDGRTTTYHISVGFGGNHAVAANVDALVSVQALTSPDEWLRPHIIRAAGALGGGAGLANHRGVALSDYHAQIYAGASGTGMPYYVERQYLIHVASGLDVMYAVNVPGVTNGGARLHVFIIWSQYHSGLNRLGLTN